MYIARRGSGEKIKNSPSCLMRRWREGEFNDDPTLKEKDLPYQVKVRILAEWIRAEVYRRYKVETLVKDIEMAFKVSERPNPSLIFNLVDDTLRVVYEAQRAGRDWIDVDLSSFDLSVWAFDLTTLTVYYKWSGWSRKRFRLLLEIFFSISKTSRFRKKWKFRYGVHWGEALWELAPDSRYAAKHYRDFIWGKLFADSLRGKWAVRVGRVVQVPNQWHKFKVLRECYWFYKAQPGGLPCPFHMVSNKKKPCGMFSWGSSWRVHMKVFAHIAGLSWAEIHEQTNIGQKLPPAAAWSVFFGRVPHARAVRCLDAEIISWSELRKHFKIFLRHVQKLPRGEDGIAGGEHAVRGLVLALALRDWAKLAEEELTADYLNLHASFNLSLVTDEAKKFYKKYYRIKPISEVLGAAANIEIILEKQAEAGRSLTWSEIKILLASIRYKGIKDQALAYACSYGVQPYTQEQFLEVQEAWLKVKGKKVAESVPNATARRGDYIMRRLAADDPFGLMAGQFVDCCQHPMGAGASCAWHIAQDTDSACYVVEKNGVIVAESWAWRRGDVIVFDNVETLSSGYSNILAELYTEVAEKLLGQLGVREVRVGSGYDDLGVEKYWKEADDIIPPPSGYSDAKHHQFVIAKLDTV